MRLTIRPADPNDVPLLVDLYDQTYAGGYSACFDRYGPSTPQDFWWVQSEKAVYLVEINAQPAGLVIVGNAGRRLLVEELLLGVPGDARRSDARGRADGTAIRQLHDFLVKRFQQERQDQLTLRCAEMNAAALTLVHQFGFAFSNALVVVAGAARRERTLPSPYLIRRAAPADTRSIVQLHEETLNVKVRGEDFDAIWKRTDARVFVAEREKFPVGLTLAQVKDGVGRWSVGVQEAHRRKGIGMALAHEALQFFHARKLMPITTYWALDTDAAQFVRRLGGKTERTYLYFEKKI
jgi:GNAT superfamily N-acetyltransferase